jgi:hypothetical protein
MLVSEHVSKAALGCLNANQAHFIWTLVPLAEVMKIIICMPGHSVWISKLAGAELENTGPYHDHV